MPQKYMISVVRTREIIDRTLVTIEADTPEMAVALLQKQIGDADDNLDQLGPWKAEVTSKVSTEQFVADENGLVLGLDRDKVEAAKATLGLSDARKKGGMSALGALGLLAALCKNDDERDAAD